MWGVGCAKSWRSKILKSNRIIKSMVEDGVSSEPISVPNHKDFCLFAGSSFPSKTGPLFLETEGALASSDHKVKAEGSSGCPEMTPNGCLLLHRNQTAGVHGMIPGNVRQVDRAELQCFNVTLNSMISIARRHLTGPEARDLATPNIIVVIE